MPSLTEFPWSRIAPETQQRLGERLRAVTPLLHTRLPLSYTPNWQLLSPPVYPLVVHLDLSCPYPA